MRSYAGEKSDREGSRDPLGSVFTSGDSSSSSASFCQQFHSVLPVGTGYWPVCGCDWAWCAGSGMGCWWFRLDDRWGSALGSGDGRGTQMLLLLARSSAFLFRIIQQTPVPGH